MHDVFYLAHGRWSLPPIPSRQEEKTAKVASYFSTPKFPLFVWQTEVSNVNVSQGKQKLSLSVDRFPILEKEQRKRKAEYAAYQRRPSWFPFDSTIYRSVYPSSIDYFFFLFDSIIILMENELEIMI